MLNRAGGEEDECPHSIRKNKKQKQLSPMLVKVRLKVLMGVQGTVEWQSDTDVCKSEV